MFLKSCTKVMPQKKNLILKCKYFLLMGLLDLLVVLCFELKGSDLDFLAMGCV